MVREWCSFAVVSALSLKYLAAMRNHSFQAILLIIKENHAPAAECGEAIAAWLQTRHVRTKTMASRAKPDALRDAANGMDAALVLGGDGAMLSVARSLLGLPVPLLGINFGKVGFLAEVPADDWQPCLQKLLTGEYFEQRHTALAWRLLRPTPQSSRTIQTAAGWAINDVVLARGTLARAVSLDLSVDDVFLSRLRCDGVIVSAPLGATAYAASAHGPLACPSLDAQLITPISPFAGAFPPLVLPSSAKVRLVAGDRGGDVHLTVDGQECLPLNPGDYLDVHGEPGQVRLLVSDPSWYLRRLGERGFILSGPGNYTSRNDSEHENDSDLA